MAANRVGKSFAAAYEIMLHATGLYPDWWEGKRFDRPVSILVAGITNESTRDVCQKILFGKIGNPGTGMIPKSSITHECKISGRPGVQNAIGYAEVAHVSGGKSDINFKSYIQGWQTFQGTKFDVVWFDEEPSDPKIYTEVLTRTAGREGDTGIILCTFTPLMGYTDIVLSYLDDGKMPEDRVNIVDDTKYAICAGWDDVPHLDEEWKKQALASYPDNEKLARTQGIPTSGSGRIFPLPEEYVIVEPFKIPSYFPRAFGIDFGWNNTAVIWAAQDPSSHIIYIYAEHFRQRQELAVITDTIRKRGSWMRGLGDPAGYQRADARGLNWFELYAEQEIVIYPAPGRGPHSKDPRIAKVQSLFEAGQLKIFSNCTNFLKEYRMYRRDEEGRIVKKNDHLIDALQYLISGFEDVCYTYEEANQTENSTSVPESGNSRITGY